MNIINALHMTQPFKADELTCWLHSSPYFLVGNLYLSKKTNQHHVETGWS